MEKLVASVGNLKKSKLEMEAIDSHSEEEDSAEPESEPEQW